MNEPKIFCPVCGRQAVVVAWFSDEPGMGFGYADCPHHGSLDFKVRYGKVESVAQPDASEAEDYLDTCLLDMSEYDREMMKLMIEEGLV